MPQMNHHRISDPMRECSQNCQECHSLCSNLVAYCLDMGGKYAEPSRVRLLLDCAEICQTSANFLVRGSLLHQRICALCAEICEQCAQSCEELKENTQMKAGADVCRRCADSCRNTADASSRAKVSYDKVVADSFPASDPPHGLSGVD